MDNPREFACTVTVDLINCSILVVFWLTTKVFFFNFSVGTSTCNDWKVLDPAIVTSSRHLPLANMAPLRDHHYGPVPPLGNTQNGPVRPYDYTNSSYSSYTPNFSFATHLNQQQQLNNWLGSDLNAPVSSPPGFRSSSQAKQQQEC